MADIKPKAVRFNSTITVTEILNQFFLMVNKLKTDTGIVLDVGEGYKSKYEVIDELKSRVKEKNQPDPTFSDLLGRPTSGSAEYDTLNNFIEQLQLQDFQPPLQTPIQSVGNPSVVVYHPPYFVDLDPRRSARLIIPTPAETLKASQTKTWLANNSILYGFLLYGDFALYYVGYDRLKQRIVQGDTVRNVVSTFLTEPLNNSTLTVTNATVLNGLMPTIPQAAPTSDLEYLVGTPVTDNNGNKPKLVVIDNKILTETTAQAYTTMKQAAKQQSVNLSLSSGFRPAFGPNVTLPTTKGRQIQVTTQESLRRDRNRWRNRQNWTGDDESFVMNAPSSYFSPQTAKPGSSNHGNGIAIDMAIGSRRTGSPLNEVAYVWLINNAHRYGFVRTVSAEEWHFEYKPDISSQGPYAVLAGTDSNSFYSDLGLTGIVV